MALRVAVLALPRAHGLRRPLPAALGAAGALGRPLPRRRRTTTACGTLRLGPARAAVARPERARARRATSPARAVELWPADLPKTLAARGARSCVRCAEGHRRAGEGDARAAEARTRGDPLTPVDRAARAASATDRLPVRARAAVPRRADAGAAFCAATRTGRSPRRCSATSGRSHRRRVRRARRQGLPAEGRGIGQAGVKWTSTVPARQGRQAQLTVDSRRRPKGARDVRDEPGAGRALRLTIDIKLQRAAERALRVRHRASRTTDQGEYADGGAIVALARSDGAVLAMASYPTYQPSIFVGRRTRRSSRRCSTRAINQRRTTRASIARSSVAYPPARRSSR